MHKTIEKITYFLGISGSAYDLNNELKLFEAELPPNYLHRSITDIGCGNGSVSLKLQKILLPKNTCGLDLSPTLIKLAQKKGLNAKVSDVKTNPPVGDLGILWGVLHHFCRPEASLQKIYHSFNSLIIRESISTKRILELGHRFNRQHIKEIFTAIGIKPSKVIESKKTNSLIFFIDHRSRQSRK
ncbi:MAG: class I SAM-dependent methyltransferase [Candidatus Shapirobacteria bacterium]